MNESAIVASLKSGSIIPDSIAGWSIKTILSGIVIILLIRGRPRGK